MRNIRLELNCAFYEVMMRINCYYSHDIFILSTQQLWKLLCFRFIDIHILLYLLAVPSRCHCTETDQITFRKMVLNFIDSHISANFPKELNKYIEYLVVVLFCFCPLNMEGLHFLWKCSPNLFRKFHPPTWYWTTYFYSNF